MMKAVLVEEGAPLKLGDFEKPNLKPGEVLVKVAASGLNRADLVQRRGAYPPPPGASPVGSTAQPAPQADGRADIWPAVETRIATHRQ